MEPVLSVPPVCIAHITTNCHVVGLDDNFMVASALHYPCHKLWVPRSKVYLLHTAPIHPQRQIWSTYMAAFGVILFPKTVASLGQMVILRWPGPCTIYTASPMLFNAYNSIMSILNHLYGQVRGDPYPTSCYVVRTDGLFMVARNLDPGFKDSLVYIALGPIMENQKCI